MENNSLIDPLYRVLILILFPFLVKAQPEEVLLHLDKSICYPQDTVWFSASILHPGGVPSTSLYTELFTDSGKLVFRKVFPTINGFCYGQWECPPTPGNYWIRSYTMNSTDNVYSLTIRGEGKKFTAKILKAAPLLSELPGNLIRLSKDNNGYFLQLLTPKVKHYSLALVDTGEPDHLSSMWMLPRDSSFTDTSYLSFEGKVTGNRSLANESLVLMIEKDSVNSAPQTIPIDTAEKVHFQGLFFYDTAYFHYMLNRGHKDDANLIVGHPLVDRPFVVPDTDAYTIQTFEKESIPLPVLDGSKYLAPAIVTSRWADRNKAIDKRYVRGPSFSWPSHFNYNLMDSSVTQYTPNVIEYLVRNLPYFKLSDTFARPPMFIVGQGRRNIEFYLDEQPVLWSYLAGKNIKELAYVKAIEDAHEPNVMICVYTRKGKDARSVAGQFKIMPVAGYDRPTRWHAPDRTTQLWQPYIRETIHHFKATPPFKFELLAVIDNKVYHWEGIMK